MADQQVRYVVYIDGAQRAEATLRSMETSANSTERSITSLNGALQGMTGALGIGIGAHGLFSFAKDAVQGAADYEAAVKRIKFASSSLEEGVINNAFIRAEVDKFKIPLQEATDDYGKFLAMLAGSDIAGDKVRELHDNLLTIAKIKGLDAGQLSAGVMNLGKMLEAGTMDARHLKPLEMQLSGIGQYLAKLMGTDVHGLSMMRNAGKLTAADPKVLTEAVRRQAQDLQQFLPESLQTMQSAINEVSNAWLDFKNNLVFDNRAELMELFAVLKDGVGYLREHKDDIVSFGHVVVNLAKAWLAYKGVMLLVNQASMAQKAFMTGYLGESAAVVTAAEAQAVAFNSLAVAMERVAYATEVMAGASLSGTVGLGALGIPLASAGAAGAAEGAAVGAGALAGVSVMGGALLVALAAGSIVALSAALSNPSKEKLNIPAGGGYYDADLNNPLGGKVVKDTLGFTTVRKFKDLSEYLNGDAASLLDTVYTVRDKFIKDTAAATNLPFADYGQKLAEKMGLNKEEAKKTAAQKKAGPAFVPNKDTVTGQRVVTYNISIREINGIKQNTVNEGGKMDPKQVAEIVRDEIIGALHDSQIRGGQ